VALGLVGDLAQKWGWHGCEWVVLHGFFDSLKFWVMQKWIMTGVSIPFG
jgi:hypothetical protein